MTRNYNDVVLTKTINVLGWLACGGRQCQQALVDAGILECLLPLLRSSNLEVVRTAWMASNWLIYGDSGKQRFLKGGGLDLLLEALKTDDLTSGVIFATRKLAMHPACRSKLLANNVHKILLGRAFKVSHFMKKSYWFRKTE